MPNVPRGKTTSLAKRSQILAYATLTGRRKVTLRQISERTGVLLSGCSNIIREAKRRAAEPGGNPDLCATENLLPKSNCEKGSNTILTEEQKQYLVAVTLSDSEHCRMTFKSLGQAGSYLFSFCFWILSSIFCTLVLVELIKEIKAGLDVSGLTVRKVLAENNIHRRKPTEKPAISVKQRAARLAFCLQYREQDWKQIIFTDESYFETGALRRRRARGVLRRPGEAFLPQNLNIKFAQGATVMFWGAILYGCRGGQTFIYLETS